MSHRLIEGTETGCHLMFDSVFAEYRWNSEYSDGDELYWINDSTEKTVSVNRNMQDEILFKTCYVVPDTGGASLTPLAYYENGSIAAFKRNFGKGTLYYVGLGLRDIGRTMINLKSDTRVGTNQMDAAIEGFLLLARGIYESRCPISVVKHTSPAATRSILSITHDVDCKTSLDSMSCFSEYEQSIGYKGHYFITTSMTGDSRGFNFYTMERMPQLQHLMACGHTIGSHSVSHLPDMQYKVPVGEEGAYTRENYHATYDGSASHNATLFAELEVSRDALQEDLGVKICSFRSGHLAYNADMPWILEKLHYNLCSNLMSRSIHTSFPYLQRRRLKTDAVSTVRMIEMPLSISDVEKETEDEEFFVSKVVACWKEYVSRSVENYAPNILLIHPNRGYKMLMQRELIESLPPGVELYNLLDYRDYWESRYNLHFTFDCEADKMAVRLDHPFDSLHCDISFLLRGARDKRIVFIDTRGEEREALLLSFNEKYDVCKFTDETRVVTVRNDVSIPMGYEKRISRAIPAAKPIRSSDRPSQGFGGGEGTAESPYLINTLADLGNLAREVERGCNYKGCCFELTQDLDLSPLCGEGVGDWLPIGTTFDKRFCGSFDGGGHTLSHLYIHNDTLDYAALFGFIDSASVTNLRIEAGYVRGGDRVALLCGRAYNHSNIENCKVTGEVSGMNHCIGGICGHLSLCSSIRKCRMQGAVGGRNKPLFTGGVCGYAAIESRIENVLYSGNVSGYEYAAGICGYSYFSHINQATQCGNIAARHRLGALCGEALLSDIGCAVVSGNVYGCKSASTAIGGIFGSLCQSASCDLLSVSLVNHIATASDVGLCIGVSRNSITEHCLYDKQAVWDKTTEPEGRSENSLTEVYGKNTLSLVGDNLASLMENPLLWTQHIRCYPQIKDQEEEAVSRLAALPIFLTCTGDDEYEIYNGVKSNFQIPSFPDLRKSETKNRLSFAGDDVSILSYGNDTIIFSIGDADRCVRMKTVKKEDTEVVGTERMNKGFAIEKRDGALHIRSNEAMARITLYNPQGIEECDIRCGREDAKQCTVLYPVRNERRELLLITIYYLSGEKESCKLCI